MLCSSDSTMLMLTPVSIGSTTTSAALAATSRLSRRLRCQICRITDRRKMRSAMNTSTPLSAA